MNEIIEHCMYESGLTADGCWNELDDYAKESIERFAVLIVKKCAELCLTYEIADGPFGEKIYRKGKHFNVMIKNHFGVEE